MRCRSDVRVKNFDYPPARDESTIPNLGCSASALRGRFRHTLLHHIGYEWARDTDVTLGRISGLGEKNESARDPRRYWCPGPDSNRHSHWEADFKTTTSQMLWVCKLDAFEPLHQSYRSHVADRRCAKKAGF